MQKLVASILLFSSFFSQNFLVHSEELINLRNYQSYQGWGAFNKAPDMAVFITSLAKEHEIATVIETGTWLGYTTSFLSLVFDEVHTIEISEIFRDKALERLKNCSNVFSYLGSSEEVLRKILPGLKEKRLLFYLDAHWEAYWPLLNELDEIAKTHRDNCMIIIDDFKIPGRPDIIYDKYGNKEASFNYIRDKLPLIYSDYTYFYVVPTDPKTAGKFIVYPSEFKR